MTNNPTSIINKYPNLYLKFFNGEDIIVGPHVNKEENLEIRASSLLNNKGGWAGKWVPCITEASANLNKKSGVKQWRTNKKDVIRMFDQKYDVGFVFLDHKSVDQFINKVRVDMFVKHLSKTTDYYEY